MLAVVQKKVLRLSMQMEEKIGKMRQRNTTSCIFEQVYNNFQFSRGVSSQIVYCFFSLSLYWECLEWCEKHSTDNLPLHSRLMHCSIRGELMRKRDPIRAEPENNSIQRMLYLCYQVLHVVVCLSENSFKIKQCEEGRSLALFAIIVQSPL